MKKLTYAELVAANSRLQHSETILSIVLNLAVNGKPEATETVRGAPGERYTFKLYGAGRASGGYVLETFHCTGQQPHSAAYRLDDLLSRMGNRGSDVRIALSRLRDYRDRTYYAKQLPAGECHADVACHGGHHGVGCPAYR